MILGLVFSQSVKLREKRFHCPKSRGNHDLFSVVEVEIIGTKVLLQF